ncbi:MAG: hypothetical protein WKG01_06505 [Kofleriaceae bacterium]
MTTGTELDPDRIPEEGILLDTSQIQRLQRALDGNKDFDVAGCFMPHHAFVFYDPKGAIVGTVDVCFLLPDGVRDPRDAGQSAPLGAAAGAHRGPRPRPRESSLAGMAVNSFTIVLGLSRGMRSWLRAETVQSRHGLDVCFRCSLAEQKPGGMVETIDWRRLEALITDLGMLIRHPDW